MSKLSIRLKLLILAGVPVAGALALALLLLQAAQKQAADAAALGSIEDVAQLSMHIGSTLRVLRLERAALARSEGMAAPTVANMTDVTPAEVKQIHERAAATDLRAAFAHTDEALHALEQFLSGRDLSKLPRRLARDLGAARAQAKELGAFRQRAAAEHVALDELLGLYNRADDALINATGALTQLSDDGQLLRAISSLVALEELTERGSREHALLSYVFTAKEFPPGAFKTLVTLITEQAVFADAFRDNAADDLLARYEADQRRPEVQIATSMRQAAVTSTEEEVRVDERAWYTNEAARLNLLQGTARDIVQRISTAAVAKMKATEESIRLSTGLSAFVVFVSALLCWWIARAITRAVGDLSTAAAQVQETKNFSIRAKKSSGDEVGRLTDAFNEMLAGIQDRDVELEAHRTGLEAKVAERTAELETRNEAMRIVLDNVDQGLAMLNRDGSMVSERSAALGAWFGSPRPGANFGAYLGGDDEMARARFELAWDELIADIMPMELNLEQMPSMLERDGRHFTLRFKPVMHEEKIDGALLVVTDVTTELEVRAEHEKQREYVAVFERVMQDRDGFTEFAGEVNRLLGSIAAGITDPKEMMMAVHTVKGNTAQWGVTSVAKIAHVVESNLVEAHEMPTQDRLQEMLDAWEAVAHRFRTILGSAGTKIELTRSELDKLLHEVRTLIPHEEISARIERLRHEAAVNRFERMARDINRLAERLGKPAPKLVIDANDLRLPASRFASFWAATVHVLRNMMDHGIEAPEVRAAAGKPEQGTVTLRSYATPDQFVLEFGDDGAGIAWDKVAEKAAEAGLPTTTQSDLERALFEAGVSTAATVSEISGRGVGMSAVLGRCEALGGKISIRSERGKGTTFTFTFPRRMNEHSLMPNAASRRPSRAPVG
jgi:two-component system, chemotaxis family, sensor kinase CheA